MTPQGNSVPFLPPSPRKMVGVLLFFEMVFIPKSKDVEDKGKMGNKVFSVVATEQQLYWS